MKETIRIPIVDIAVGVRTHGLKAGKLAVFIETHTPYVVNPLVHVQCDSSVELSLEQIQARIETVGEGCRDISIIGPEPLFTRNIDHLLRFLDMHNYIVEVDTYGNAPLNQHRVKRTSPISMLNRLERSSNIRFLLYYASGNTLYTNELSNLSSDDTLICRIRSEADLDDCIQLSKTISTANICFTPVSSLISPKLVMQKIVEEKLWGIRYQPTIQDISIHSGQK